MSSVGLIINSKSNRSADILDDILHVAKSAGDVRTCVLDGVTGLDKALIGMNKDRVDTLILAGGDGTMQAAFTDSINNRRFDKSPHYVALPCGMTNVIANDCGLKGSPSTSLDNFLWRRRKGAVQPVRRPIIASKVGNRDNVYGFFLGAAGFHSAVKYSRERVQTKGAKRSLALIASTLGYTMKVALDTNNAVDEIDMEFLEGIPENAPKRADQLLFMATTLNKLGSGIYPFWGEGTGAMATTSIEYPASRILRAAPTIVRSKSKPWFEEYGYRSWRSDQMVLKFRGSFVSDGEIYETGQGEETVLAASHNVNFLN